MTYEGTAVAVERSEEQIKKLLRKFSVQAMRFTSYPSYATLEFVRKDKEGKLVSYRIRVIPKVAKYARNPPRELDQAERQVWRVVYWWLKSKIEAIDFGLVEFEDDFLPYLLLTNDTGGTGTVAEMLKPRLQGLAQGADLFGGLQRALPNSSKTEE